MRSDEIRQMFLRFFEEKEHNVISSASLIPHGDPTLLLTTAGMVQIKPYFMGLAVPPNPRLVSCQKCFRTTDIDSVGDANHLTFFEMLGNFSVGDYFKREAIAWAWEFTTQFLKLPPDRLWVTVYSDDDEAFDYWQEIGFPKERIWRFGDEDNFWGPAGDSGPCGPCSEIHYDFGEKAGCGKPECKPNCDCGRFSEIWNLVFTQYNQDRDGKRSPLPEPNIDTGMGLERAVAATQNKPSIYNTDLFIPLLDKICDLTDKKYGNDEIADQAIRITAEHSRGTTFLIADGVLPSNEGRGYVLRRVLRRACFFGRKLGIEKPFLSEVAECVINKMGHVYPELGTNRDLVIETIQVEEEKFIGTLDTGTNLAQKLIHEVIEQGEDHLPGEDVFRLWDTYGFPVELTAEIARESWVSVDIKGFESEMERQKERARTANKFGGNKGIEKDKAVDSVMCVPEPTNFVGYDELNSSSKINYILDPVSGAFVKSANAGDKVAVILDKTTFYGEMGGQLGDSGEMIIDSAEVSIINTIWSPFGSLADGAIVHLGQVTNGTISVGNKVIAKVNAERRLDIARNHTATHLLQMALRQVLGSHVYQKGSLVTTDRLRFDFSHSSAISKQQLDEIQSIVNDKIRQNLVVRSKVIPYKQAIDEGAIALFEERYGDTVRVMEIGCPQVSAELCGGTHVKSTGEIGFFMITDEGSIGTSLRRIEAVTGKGVEALLKEHLETLEAVARELKSSPVEVEYKVKALIAELSAERKRSATLERELVRNTAEALAEQAETLNGITVLTATIPAASMSALRDMGDLLRKQLKSVVLVLGTVYDDRPSFMCMVTPDLVAKGLHAGDIVKRVATVTGGGGGGKAEIAQAGGQDKNKLDEALELAKHLVRGLASS